MNRTSAPGLFAKEIVPLRGMGSMSSAFRHFLPWLNSKAPDLYTGQSTLSIRGMMQVQVLPEGPFHDRECKEPSASPFKRVLVGASPTTVAIHHCSRSPTAEALRRERSQCRCNSRREHHFEPEA